MAIRVLLVPLFHVVEDDRRALDAAFILAKRFQSHVDALLVQPDPADAVPLVGEGVSAETIRRLMEGTASVIDQQQQVANDLFEERVAAAEIALVEHGAVSSGDPSAAWLQVTGHSEDVVPEKALFSDLVVFTGAGSNSVPTLRPTFEAVLLKSRRPILLVPENPVARIGHDVAIAWNGTPEARNALAAAMTFLKQAVVVHLLTAASTRTDTDTLNHAQHYLARHGVGSQSHVIETGGLPIGVALTQKAVDIGADLLVMGGYGHARLRERILGGVTHHIVNQPELPILLAH